MEIIKAIKLINNLMEEHLDTNVWSFKLDNARKRGGACHYQTRTISMSRHLIPMWSEEEIRETMLHEIGHALAGYRAGHNHVWAAHVRSIGGNPSRTHDNATVQGRYRVSCPNGHTHYRHRRPSHNRPRSCGKCSNVFNPEYLLTITDTKMVAA